MNELLEWMDYIEDIRQEKKVLHKLKDIIVIVLFATLANVDDWVGRNDFTGCPAAALSEMAGTAEPKRGRDLKKRL